ncbi:MAG: YfhO family protein [Acidimicrobiales bacterium]
MDGRFRPRVGLDLLAVCWLVVIGLAMLAPALIRGPYLGPYHVLAHSGLFVQPGRRVTLAGNSDLITEMIPWTALSWAQVHTGHLPLWNASSGFGMPLAFNWQSAAFSLPALIGYLVPLQWAFTIGVIVTLVVAGTGAYVFARVLGLSVLACVMAGTFFELSGPFLGWLGYPLGAVQSWLGWLLAAGILVVEGRHRARDTALFAVVLALAVFAGNPESLVVLAFAVALFLAGYLVLETRRRGSAAVIRASVFVALAATAGAALAAPLALPGTLLAQHTFRSGLGGHSTIPFRYLTLVLLPNGFKALVNPTLFSLGSHTSSAIGFIATPLALVAVARYRHRPVISLLASLTVVFLVLAFVGPVDSLVDHLPLLGNVYWSRALIPMALSLAVLAGMGADVFVRDRDRVSLLCLGGGFAALGLWLVTAWFGRQQLPPSQARALAHAFVWPVIDVGVGLLVTFVLFSLERWGRLPAHRQRSTATGPEQPLVANKRGSKDHWRTAGILALFGVQTATLVAVGATLWQSSPSFLPTSPGITALRSVVGTGRVGVGLGGCVFGGQVVGMPQELNVAYGIHMAGIYDPMIPKRYFTAWQADTGQSGGVPLFASFCPQVTTSAVGRRFGIGYVLVAHGSPGPRGSRFIRTLGEGSHAEDLYRIAGASLASVVPISASPMITNAIGRPIAVSSPNPSTFAMTVSVRTPSVVHLHITDVSGWRATIDGKPLVLSPYQGIMMQADVPSGNHIIVITYWPTSFSLGILLAVLAAIGLLLAMAIGWWIRRQLSSSDSDLPSGGSAQPR